MCLCVQHSCSPSPANQTWQVRYHTKADNQGKVEIILLFAFGGKQKCDALKCGGFQTIYANVKLCVCLCVGHSCSALAANQTWQVRYQTQADNQGKVQIILLFVFGGKEKWNCPKFGAFDTIYANVNRTDVSVALSRAVNK